MLTSEPVMFDHAVYETFEVSSGSVPGRRHTGTGNLLCGRNNQDAVLVTIVRDTLLLAVFDGCGSGSSSEFGAMLGRQLLASAVAAALEAGENPVCNSFWHLCGRIILKKIECIASTVVDGATQEDLQRFIRSHLLFTISGALVCRELTVLFGCGDGVFYVNGDSIQIGPFDENAPPYLAHNLIAGCGNPFLEPFETYPTSRLQELMVCTDGALDLFAAKEARVPGKEMKVGDPAGIFHRDELFGPVNLPHGGDRLTGWLRQLNSEVVRMAETPDGKRQLVRARGLLPDDTSIAACRRARGANHG